MPLLKRKDSSGGKEEGVTAPAAGGGGGLWKRRKASDREGQGQLSVVQPSSEAGKEDEERKEEGDETHLEEEMATYGDLTQESTDLVTVHESPSDDNAEGGECGAQQGVEQEQQDEGGHDHCNGNEGEWSEDEGDGEPDTAMHEGYAAFVKQIAEDCSEGLQAVCDLKSTMVAINRQRKAILEQEATRTKEMEAKKQRLKEQFGRAMQALDSDPAGSSSYQGEITHEVAQDNPEGEGLEEIDEAHGDEIDGAGEGNGSCHEGSDNEGKEHDNHQP